MAEENKKPRRKPGQEKDEIIGKVQYHKELFSPILNNKRDIVCLLYTSDAADERSSVDLGGRRIIKKKNNKK